LLPGAGLQPTVARWTGHVKYDFTGGNNDPDALPLDGLIAATALKVKGVRFDIFIESRYRAQPL
jgi:hypothetical protein